MIDLDKLGPADWTYQESASGAGDAWLRVKTNLGYPIFLRCSYFRTDQDWMNAKEQVKFCVLARQAFDVCLRRGWSLIKDSRTGAWVVDVKDSYGLPHNVSAADPFSALVAADQWYRENVESKTTPAKG